MTMLLNRFLLYCLLTALLLEATQSKKITCKDSCCFFVEEFPLRLKALRNSYNKIRDYYESMDDLESSLFNKTILDHFKGPYGCKVMDDVLHFYLNTVLPSAISGDKNHKRKTHIDTIGDVFHQLKRQLIKCRNYFTCKNPFEVASIRESYSQMGEKGLYKAMGQLDLLFNYIEDYLVSKRHSY